MSPRFRRIALVLTILIACVGCDQKAKSVARARLQGHATMSFLGDAIRLDYAENPGGFLSLGHSLAPSWRMAIFTLGAGIAVLAVLLYAFLAPQSAIQAVALALICGGGIGNLIDRVMYGGYVTDFLNVGVGPVRTGIFNIADMAWMAGCVLLLIRPQQNSQRP